MTKKILLIGGIGFVGRNAAADNKTEKVKHDYVRKYWKFGSQILRETIFRRAFCID